LEVKTILNRIQHFVGFVYQEVRLCIRRGRLCIEVKIEPHRSIRGRCAECGRSAPGYDRLPERSWLFVPLWGMMTWFVYAPRRVECAEHGVGVEHVPWGEGKRPIPLTMLGFLARWARRRSWREPARALQTSWEAVYRSVAWYVQWGLVRRRLEGVESIGIDELHWGKGQRADHFLTVI
jgi:transposase